MHINLKEIFAYLTGYKHMFIIYPKHLYSEKSICDQVLIYSLDCYSCSIKVLLIDTQAALNDIQYLLSIDSSNDTWSTVHQHSDWNVNQGHPWRVLSDTRSLVPLVHVIQKVKLTKNQKPNQIKNSFAAFN